MNKSCQEFMSRQSLVKSLMNLMSIHKKDKPIVIRAAFILGNLTFMNSEVRTYFSIEKGN